MTELIRSGYQVLEGYLSSKGSERLLVHIDDFRQQNQMTDLHRPMKGGRYATLSLTAIK